MNQEGHSFLIVLYKSPLSQSQAYQDLKPQLAPTDHLIVFDNSPESMLDVDSDVVTYHHDASNSGLAVAYNFAVSECRRIHDRWLTIFDQDTKLPTNFTQVLSEAEAGHDDATVFVPEISLENGVHLSPFWIEDALFLHYPASQPKTLAAINSGMTLNLDAFTRDSPIFDQRYPLDFLDYVFFKSLQERGQKLDMLPTKLIQALSLKDFRTMTQSRFASFQLAEARFVEEFYPTMKFQYRLRILLRIVKQLTKRAQWAKVKLMFQVIGGKTS